MTDMLNTNSETLDEAPLAGGESRAKLGLKFYLAAVTVAILYILFHYWMEGIHRIHFVYIGLMLLLVLLTKQTRCFFLIALPLFIHNILYDMFRYIPFHWLQPIRVKEVYALDKFLFGFSINGDEILLHQYLLKFASPALDIFAGILYHLLDPMVFILLLLLWKLRSSELAFRFSLAFFVMNLFAFATYLLFPAAAPWYVNDYGFTQPLGPVIGSAAGMANFDKLLSVDISQQMYKLNPVVFGAVPSMHAGFSILSWFFARKINRLAAYLFAFYALGMCFSALYLQHHYLVDLVWGMLYAMIAYLIVEKVFLSKVNRVHQKIFGSL